MTNLFFFCNSTEPIVDHTAAENVVVPESGEDSEDEWNYIKVQQKEEVEQQPQPELIAPEEQETSFGGEPIYPIDDDGTENVEELHAVSQALAESQEACSEVRLIFVYF